MHATTGGTLSFTLMGGFAVTRDGRRVGDAAWERRVAQRVVRYLLVSPRGLVTDDELLETFWPDADADGARRSLRVAVSRARHVLDLRGAPTVIGRADRAYRLHLDPRDTVDAERFAAAAGAGLASRGAGRVALLEQAASLWGGEPLPEERYSDWALDWRERLTCQYAGVLTALADGCLERGDLTTAGLRAADLAALDPLDEGAHRRLMVTHARAGRREQALRQFHECRRALVAHLGVEPAAETTHLQQRILEGQFV